MQIRCLDLVIKSGVVVGGVYVAVVFFRSVRGLNLSGSVDRGGFSMLVCVYCVSTMILGCSSALLHGGRYYGAEDTKKVMGRVVDSGLNAAAISNFADVDKAYRSGSHISILGGSFSMPPLRRNLDVAAYHLRYLKGGMVGWVDVEFDLRGRRCHSIDVFSYNFNAIVQMQVHGSVAYHGSYSGFNVVATPDSDGQGCISRLKIYR